MSLMGMGMSLIRRDVLESVQRILLAALVVVVLAISSRTNSMLLKITP